jgi:uracil-DNA glycosylase family 4
MSEATVTIFGTPDQTYPETCPLHKNNCVTVGGNGAMPCDVLIVGETPYKYEIAGRMAFHPQAPAGTQLRRLAEGMFPEFRVRYTNVMRCAAMDENGGPRKPSPKEISAWLPYLSEEIQLCQPKIIILCGGTAIQAVMNWSKVSVDAVRGKPVFRDNVVFIPTYHPSMMTPSHGKDPSTINSYMNMILADFEVARKILIGELTQPQQIDYDIVENEADAYNLLRDISGASEYALDIETNSYKKTPIDTEFKDGFMVTSFAVSWQPNKAIVVPTNSIETNHCKHPAKFQPSYAWQKSFVTELWNLPATHIGQNFGYDGLGLALYYGVDPYKFYWDTILMHHLLHPHRQGKRSLEQLASEYTIYGGYARSFETEVNKVLPVSERGYHQVPFDMLANKNAHDAAITLELCQKFREELKKDEPLWKLYHEVYIPTSFTLMRMTERGLKVDPERYRQVKTDVWMRKNRFLELMQICPSWKASEEHLGRPLDLSKAIDQVLFLYTHSSTQLAPHEIVLTGKTKTPSLAQKPIKALSKKSIEAEIFQLYKKHKTMEDKTLKVIPNWIGYGGRIHPTFNLYGTKTGRLSVKNPNSQQIPKGEEGREPIKDLFVPEPGYIYLYSDISQAELRMLAHVTQDPFLLDAVERTDVHREMAAIFYKKPVNKVTDEERSLIKKINFAIVYGANAWKIAHELGISEEDAQEMIDRYWGTFPSVMEKLVEPTKCEVLAKNEVRSLFGRKWVNGLYDLKTAKEWEVNEVFRQAINFKIQSPTSDMVLKGMNAFAESMSNLPPKSHYLVNEVHDSVLDEVLKKYLVEATEKMVYHMEHPPIPFPMSVSWRAEIKAGYSMGELEDVIKV